MAFLGAGTGLCVVLTFLAWRALLAGDYTGRSEIYGTILAVGCVLVTLMAIFALVGTSFYKTKMPSVAVDHFGVWWVFRGQSTLTPWQVISAVATSFKRRPAISFSVRRPHEDYAFEVFLRDPSLLERHDFEALRRWSVTREPYRAGLPSQRLRFMLPMADMRHELSATVLRHAPQLWIGEYQREWTRLPGT